VTLHGGSGGENAAKSDRYNVSWGFVEVLPDRVTILANDALAPSQIDVERARQQLNHGQELWNQAGDSEEKYTEAERVINEAEAKLASAGSATHN
jgi:F-type H+-transporting ATPase subunit epsilon